MTHSDSLTPQNDGEGALLRRVIDHAPLGAFLCDGAGRILYANQAVCELLGYSLEELKSLCTDDIDARYSVEQARQLVEAMRERGEELVMQTRLRRRDGAEFSAEIFLNVSGCGEEALALSFLRDASQVERQLAEREQLGFLVENASDAVYIYDDQRRIVYVNRHASLLTGYSREELLGMNIADLDPSYPATPPDSFHRLARQNRTMVFETEHRLRNGRWVPVEVSLSVNLFKGEIYNCAYVRDISDRKAYLRELEDFRQALEHTSDAVYLYDGSGIIRYANWTACEELGYRKEELVGAHISCLDPTLENVGRPDGRLAVEEMASSHPVQAWHRRKDGSRFPVEVVISASNFADGDCVLAFARDISERLQSQQALAESEERFRLVAEALPVGLVISRVTDLRVLYANQQAAKLFACPAAALSQAHLNELFQASGAEAELLERLNRAQQLHNHEFLLGAAHEPSMWVSLTTRILQLRGEKLLYCVMQDVTEARELSNQLSYHATFDDLTGLVNRREFEDRLQEVIELAAREDSENALCYLDLDQFKVINDTCGHMAGDELLRQLAHVLYQSVRRDDTLARLGGDEFAILLEHCSLTHAEQVAAKVRQAVQAFRFQWQGKTFNISVSIGLVPIANSGETISDVMRRADTACYAAKDAGRNRIYLYRFGDEELLHRHGEMQWVSRVTAALDGGRLELWQQPIRPLGDAEQGEHFELLLRMRDEDGRLIMPGAFLPAAERYDLASRIDRWVIHTAFAWLERHPKELQALSSCAINLSGRTLSDSQFLEETVQFIRESRVPTEKICFEITETAAIANLGNVSQFMRALKTLGCKFALDDFGSGLSSFAYLKNLPVDYVKIDGFFVKDITSDPVDLAMVKAINDMAHAMDKQTIAEFVEDQAVLDHLIEVGVDYVQGYGIARPRPLIPEAESLAEPASSTLPRR